MGNRLRAGKQSRVHFVLRVYRYLVLLFHYFITISSQMKLLKFVIIHIYFDVIIHTFGTASPLGVILVIDKAQI